MPADTTGPDTWNPAQYGRFAAERSRPFDDLLALVEAPVERAVDLGCGTGELTARLHEARGITTTLGIDSSPAMLEKAAAARRRGRCASSSATSAGSTPAPSTTSSSATRRCTGCRTTTASSAGCATRSRPGGQLAVQVPANGDHPSHALPFEIAHEPPFRAAMLDHGDPLVEATPVLAPESYAALLDELGFTEQSVRLQVYGHHLASTADVVEWTRGTTLTRYERALPARPVRAVRRPLPRPPARPALGEPTAPSSTRSSESCSGASSHRRSAAPTVTQVRQAGRAPTRRTGGAQPLP